MLPSPPRSPLFPYTTLFRSIRSIGAIEPRGANAPVHIARNARQTCEVQPAIILSASRSEEHTSELQSHSDLVCRLLLEKKKQKQKQSTKTPMTTPQETLSSA